MEHEGDGDANRSWCAWNSPQKFGKKPGGFRNQRKNRDHTDHSIAKIGRNTEKSPGDLKRLAVTQILVKYYQQILVRKICKEYNYNNNKILERKLIHANRPTNECPTYDTEQSDGEAPVMLEFGECGVPLHCHSSQIYGVVAPERILPMVQIELLKTLTECKKKKKMSYAKLNC